MGERGSTFCLFKIQKKIITGVSISKCSATFGLKVVQHISSYQTNRDATCKILYCVIEFHGLGDFITPSRFSVKKQVHSKQTSGCRGFSLFYSQENHGEIKILKDHVSWSFMIGESGLCWVEFSCMSRTPECVPKNCEPPHPSLGCRRADPRISQPAGFACPGLFPAMKTLPFARNAEEFCRILSHFIWNVPITP